MQLHYTGLDFELSEEFVGLVLGMDHYLRLNHGESLTSVSGESLLVPVNMTDTEPISLKDIDGAISRLERIKEIYLNDTGIHPHRKIYMPRQISAVILLAQWLTGRQVPFPDLVKQLLDVDANPVPVTDEQRLRDQLARLLKEEGFKGELPQAVNQWRQHHIIAGGSVCGTLEALIQTLRQKSVEAGFQEAADLNVGVELVYQKRYSAYCDYFRKKILINGDLTYSYWDLKHLAAHEAFPGHMLHMAIRHDQAKKRHCPPDAGLVITDTPSSPIFEGIAENGITLLDAKESINDNIYEIYRSIQSISCLNASYLLHGLNRPIEDVERYLRANALSDERWIASRIQFLKPKLFAPFIYGYWRGFEAVGAVIFKTEKSQKLALLKFLLENMHCTSSLHYATGLSPEPGDNGRMSGLHLMASGIRRRD